jgi:hypothetical protein
LADRRLLFAARARAKLDGDLRAGDDDHAAEQIGCGPCRRMGMMSIDVSMITPARISFAFLHDSRAVMEIPRRNARSVNAPVMGAAARNYA